MSLYPRDKQKIAVFIKILTTYFLNESIHDDTPERARVCKHTHSLV
jgi:hypothetical protein